MVEEEEEEDPESVQKECLELFSQRDFIMESNILNVLKRWEGERKLQACSKKQYCIIDFIIGIA